MLPGIIHPGVYKLGLLVVEPEFYNVVAYKRGIYVHAINLKKRPQTSRPEVFAIELAKERTREEKKPAGKILPQDSGRRAHQGRRSSAAG